VIGGRAVRALRALPARTPLRVKLVAALLVLVTLGLVAAGTAGAFALRGYLIDRLDEQLRATARGQVEHLDRERPATDRDPRASGVADRDRVRAGSEDGYRRPALSTAFYIRYADAAGGGGGELIAPEDSDQAAPVMPALDWAAAVRRAGTPFTAPASGAGHGWRLLVTPLPDGSGSITVGLSLDDVDDTVARLVTIELIVGGAVVGALAGLGYALVRSSLRPLVRAEATAAAIAGGDLTRRVPSGHERTEVGRLAAALNGMLSQIEAAFDAQRASEAQARASEARMRRFVADASHELRTPLTTIRGFAELVRRQPLAEAAAVAEAAQRIERAATRMGVLVDDLLLLARLDQHRPLRREPVDLLGVVADAVGEARVRAPRHPITVRLAEDEAPPVVAGDEDRLTQVIGNLLGNAATHTPAGTDVTVTVRTEGDRAVIEVADTGPGLPAGDVDRVFERFYRADAARDRTTGGAGLGLSIVDSIVAAHGGSVGVRSVPGEGAQFEVRLPLLDAAPAPTVPP
jgi:two-component system OmpR family sensor kinase